MARAADDLLTYYRRELDYVRQAGREFARMHPQTAARLELGGMESPDPHVERLIESFAFLTGRLRRDLDNEFPQIAGALLESLHPNFTAPIPSMTVVRFAIDAAQGKASAGRSIARDTPLMASGWRERGVVGGAAEEVPCQFRTCSELTLWPIDVSVAAIEDASLHPTLAGRSDIASVLRLRLSCQGDVQFGTAEGCIDPDRLRFHLYGDWAQVNPLYQMLLCDLARPVLVTRDAPLPDAATAAASPVSWHEVGFGADEAALPAPPNAHPGYRLLQEYFAFARKFMFFEARGLAGLWQARVAGQRAGSGPREQCADLLLPLRSKVRPGLQVQRSQFLLGCTPAVNLFPRTSETLRVDQRSVEYRLNPDARRESTTEIHSILSLDARVADGQPGVPLEPYFSFGQTHDAAAGAQYVARRDHALSAQMGGTDVYLSFVDLDHVAGMPAAPLVSAQTLCTNRGLAESIAPDDPGLDQRSSAPGAFKAVSSIGVLPVLCLYRPTRQIAPPLGGDRLWRLVALLNLHHLSLENGEQARRALRQLLELCNGAEGTGGTRQIAALNKVACNSVVRPVRSGPAPGFRRGYEIQLHFDEGAFNDGSPLLLAAVLQRFFPLYAAVNSFASVTVMRGEDKVKEWTPATAPR